MLPLISRAPCLNCPWIVSARTISTSARLDVAGRPDYSAKRNPINFRDFPLANRVGQYDIKHTPDNLLLKHYNYPLCEDTFGQKLVSVFAAIPLTIDTFIVGTLVIGSVTDTYQ